MRTSDGSPRSSRLPHRLSLAASVAAGVCLVAVGVAAAEPGDPTNACTEAGLSGALWGLCNAYCEALDCDGDEPGGSETACAALERNFMRKSGGEPLPCRVPDCPCFTAEEVTALALTLSDASIYENLRCIDRRPGKPITALAADRIDDAPCSPSSNDCSALSVEFTEDNACELNTPSESRLVQEITEGEREACRNAVIEGAQAAELDCR